MTTSQQKDRELAQLQKAFKLLGIKSYEIVDKHKESPDFLINIDGQSIGVEVTELYRDSRDGNSAKTQADLPKIVNEAIKIYDQKKGEPFSFAVGFNGRIAVKNRTSTSRELADFLFQQSKQIPNQSSQIRKLIPDKTKWENLQIVNSVCAQRIPGLSAVGFVVSSFNSIEPELDALESIIEEKSKLIPKYRERCDIIWLLITLPRMTLAGDLILQESEFTSPYHGFDDIYILDDYGDQIQRINVRQGSCEAGVRSRL